MHSPASALPRRGKNPVPVSISSGGLMRARIACVLVFVVVAAVSGRQAKPSSTASGTAAADVLAFEKTMEAAVVRGDVGFLDGICAPDFSFTHGDGWTTGGQPLRVENKAQWLASVSKAPYLSRDLDSVQVEMHWGHRHHLRTVPRAKQISSARPRHLYRVVRARVCV